MNGIIGKVGFHLLRDILYSMAIYYIVIGKHQKTRNKMTQPVKWSTQGSDFQKNYTTNVEFIPPELDAKKNVTYNFQVNEL